ncbi:MAG: hypothetical protein LHW50_02565 [Candidatus Cloacimonetes bacterium]|nr:hypothetical protein [Candidatus Cloacimonadota bacterium]
MAHALIACVPFRCTGFASVNAASTKPSFWHANWHQCWVCLMSSPFIGAFTPAARQT